MGTRTATRIAWSLVALTLATLTAALVLLILGVGTPLPASAFGFKGWRLILGSAFAVAGVLIASRVPSNPIVRLAQTDGMLAFEVTDDGRGFDPASRGTGLQGIADRLAALGGAVEIRSAVGAGTRIAGTLPTTAETST